MDDKKEELSKVTEEIQSLIQFSDNKANILLVTLSIVLSIALSTMNKFVWFDNMVKSVLIILFLVSIAVNLLTLLIMVIRPRKGKTTIKNLNYFADIVKLNKQDYINCISSESITIEQIAEQNYNLSELLKKKTFWLKTCLYTTCVNIVLMIVVFIL